MVLICPYCDIEINEKQLEAEDGCCPECGAFITANNVISDGEDEYSEDDEFGEDDDFGTGLRRSDEYEDDEFADEFSIDDDDAFK